jgi:type I restriction enzyme M protein
MAKRHAHRAGDWSSVAVRLDEIISASSGEDPFEEALTLLVARLAYESAAPARRGDFASRVDTLLSAAARRWPGIIESGRRTNLSRTALSRCAAVLDDVSLLADDLVGLDAIFEHITARAAKGQKGQFFTPRHVIREVVHMLAPRAGEHVLDPACGSGGFLCHTLSFSPSAHVHGFDLDPRAARIARVMLLGRGEIQQCDSLGTGSWVASSRDKSSFPLKCHSADVILTNPPFAGDVGDAYRDQYELARSGRRIERDVLFIERCIQLLRPGGRFAIVLPHNKVGGDPYDFVRKWLIERAQLVAVIGLGRNTFQPHTSQKACVVIGVKRERAIAVEAARREEILFFLSERDGKDHRGQLVRRADGAIDHDLADAVPLVRARFDAMNADMAEAS